MPASPPGRVTARTTSAIMRANRPTIMNLTTRSTPRRKPMPHTVKQKITAAPIQRQDDVGSLIRPPKKPPTCSGVRPERSPLIMDQQ